MLENYWRLFIIFPGAVAISRLIIAFFVCNHDTPIQYMIFYSKAEHKMRKIDDDSDPKKAK